MSKCDFNKVSIRITLRHGCSPVNLLHIFRTAHLKNTSGWGDCFCKDMFVYILNPIQDGGQKGPPTSFSPVTSTNVRISPQNFFTFELTLLTD